MNTDSNGTYADILQRLHPHLDRLAGGRIAVTEDMELVAQLGLDSIKVLDLIMEIEDEFDLSIPMNVLADVRTVRDLARAIGTVAAERQ
jgi:acyl carrier protein